MSNIDKQALKEKLANMTPQERAELKRKLKIKKKNKKINQVLIYIVLAMCIITCAFMAYNLFKVSTKKSNAAGEVLEVETNKESNDLYTIGNNPTDIERTYFKELTQAINDNDEQKIAESVVKNFVSDYFTWTNKDGNYDVGGSQYIYGSMALSFIEQSRYQFYSDLDLYINDYGRENLLEVSDVTITSCAKFYHSSAESRWSYDGYYIEASWTYKNCDLNTSEFQRQGFFYVLKNSDSEPNRYEIMSFSESWDTYTEDLNEAYGLEG